MKNIWQKNNLGDFVCKLGRLEKAIVVSKTGFPDNNFFKLNYKWRISIRSFLPFTDEEYNKEFSNPEDCCLFAEQIVVGWLKSLIASEPNTKLESDNTKLIIE